MHWSQCSSCSLLPWAPSSPTNIMKTIRRPSRQKPTLRLRSATQRSPSDENLTLNIFSRKYSGLQKLHHELFRDDLSVFNLVKAKLRHVHLSTFLHCHAHPHREGEAIAGDQRFRYIHPVILGDH